MRMVWLYWIFDTRWPKGLDDDDDDDADEDNIVATLTGQYWWKQDLYDNGGYIFKFNEQEEAKCSQVDSEWSLLVGQKCRVTRLNDVLIRRT